ncbi:hypothetical protein MATL_G00060680 [Megalops atlanticus]|uniref:Uncharacterized protein n=1 Tax=Megalops atlanticus TaxID=7932 RepID=A0A9D3Q6V4_MEGAT|nr:hypothetical protein MATL_G00060680 [Megalops atlanticus]
MWQGLRAIPDYKGSSGGVINTDPSVRDELNLFHTHFERENSEPTTKMANHPVDYERQLSESKLALLMCELAQHWSLQQESLVQESVPYKE